MYHLDYVPHSRRRTLAMAVVRHREVQFISTEGWRASAEIVLFCDKRKNLQPPGQA